LAHIFATVLALDRRSFPLDKLIAAVGLDHQLRQERLSKTARMV
jgi:hypothetical protein